MKRRTLAATLALATLTAASLPSSGIAHRHSTGGSHDHLWLEDREAYRSYRETAPDVAGATRDDAGEVAVDRTEGHGEGAVSEAMKDGASVAERMSSYGGAAFDSKARSLDPIDFDYLEESLRLLAGEKDPVLRNRGNAQGRAAARIFLKREFQSSGFSVREENYGRGANLIAERAGRSGKFLVVSAHFDSVDNPGADDDGTGTAALLATAKLLKGRGLENGVRFVAFDQEEIGLVGSAAHVKALVASGAKGSVLGDLQMEMMGYNAKKDGKFHVISCDRPDSQFLVNAFTSVVAKLGGLTITRACTDRSDHSSFWEAEIPAVVISENFFGGDSNPCYHRSCDTVDTVDFGYFRKVANAAANVVLLVATTEASRTPPSRPTPRPTGGGSAWPKSTRSR